MKKFTVLAILLMLLSVVAESATLSPMPRLYFRNSAGTQPLSFGRAYTYEPGTSTPKATYTDSTGATANTNPIVLGSDGGAVFFLSGCYDISLVTSAGVPLYTTPNVCEYEEAAASSALVSQWNPSGITPVFLGTTSFSTAGDYTDVFTPGLRLKSTTTAGTIYSTVVSAVYAATVTTVTVANDSGVLDSGLSEVQISVLTVANPSMPVKPVIAKTSGYTMLATDCGSHLEFNVSSAATYTLLTATNVPSGCTVVTKNTSTFNLTISGSVDGLTSMTVPQSGEVNLWAAGSGGWHSVNRFLADTNTGILHSSSTVTAPNVIPVAGADGTLDPGFISDPGSLNTTATTTSNSGSATITTSLTTTVGDIYLVTASGSGDVAGAATGNFSLSDDKSGLWNGVASPAISTRSSTGAGTISDSMAAIYTAVSATTVTITYTGLGTSPVLRLNTISIKKQ